MLCSLLFIITCLLLSQIQLENEVYEFTRASVCSRVSYTVWQPLLGSIYKILSLIQPHSQAPFPGSMILPMFEACKDEAIMHLLSLSQCVTNQFQLHCGNSNYCLIARIVHLFRKQRHFLSILQVEITSSIINYYDQLLLH